MIEFLIGAAVFLITYAGVRIFRKWSEGRRLLDLPNERSSHTIPTPRGGGLIIVFASLAAYLGITIFRQGNFHWSYLLGAALIASISWLDDLYTVSFVWRFIVHTVGAALVILTLGYFDEVYLPLFGSFHLGIGGAALTFLWIVWLTNAYNFMDGIDGIAGLQAVTAGIGWALAAGVLEVGSVGLYGVVIATAGLGFLIQNWQPAKIFMGDVGSAFLGYTFAVLPLLANRELGAARAGDRKYLLPLGALLVWLFVFDTLFTFGRRVLNRERVWEAHRGHVYQRFVIRGISHRSVSGLYGVISALNVAAAIRLLKYQDRVSEIGFLLWIATQSCALLAGLYILRGRQPAVKE